MPLLEDGKGEHSFVLTLTFAEATRTCLGRGENANGNTAKSSHVSFFRARLSPSEKSRIVNAAVCTTFSVGQRRKQSIRREGEADHFHESTTALQAPL